jgi:uncharacterized protein
MPGYPTDHAGLEMLPFDDCLRLLASVPVSRVGFIADGELVILPVNHVVDGHDVAFRTARGSKLSAAKGQNLATFEVDHYNEQTRSGWSVVVTGRAEVVDAEADVQRLARRGLHPWGHHRAAPVLDPDPAHLGQWTADTGNHVVTRPVIPEGAGPCQPGFSGFAVGERACVTGVSGFPGSCHVRGEWLVRSRTGRSPAAAGGAGGVLEVTGQEPDVLAAWGNGSRGFGGVCGCAVASQWSGVISAGSAAGCSHPFACPGRGRVAWGGARQDWAVRRGQSTWRPRRPGAAGQTDRRPRAWPLARKAVHAARAGGGSWAVRDRQRICPSRRP